MEQNTDQPSLTAILTGDPTFKCDQCGKSFAKQAGLTMHTMRVHSKALGTGYRWKAKANEEERLARRREYQRKLRERYRLTGRDGRGYPIKTGKGRGGNKGMKLRSWTPARRRKFQRTMRKKAMSQAGAQLFEAGGKPRKRIQYIYPTPVEQGVAPLGPNQFKSMGMNYCPECGAHIAKWHFEKED